MFPSNLTHQHSHRCKQVLWKINGQHNQLKRILTFRVYENNSLKVEFWMWETSFHLWDPLSLCFYWYWVLFDKLLTEIKPISRATKKKSLCSKYDKKKECGMIIDRCLMSIHNITSKCLTYAAPHQKVKQGKTAHHHNQVFFRLSIF